MWLDLARYSDTYGFEKDPHRDIWPFRDWVIRAFNADMPFDQFTIKQLAGDLLPEPEPDDLIATAFHRNTQNNTEGGTDDEEYRMAAVIDRVNTTWTAWNATTFGCVQCHAHPYDPIPHEDYYAFLAFFNNSEDVDLNHDFPRTKVAEDRRQQADAVQPRTADPQPRARRSTNAAPTSPEDRLTGSHSLRTNARIEPRHRPLTQQQNGDFLSSGTNPERRGLHPHRTRRTLRRSSASRSCRSSDDPTEWDEQGAVVSQLRGRLHRRPRQAPRDPAARGGRRLPRRPLRPERFAEEGRRRLRRIPDAQWSRAPPGSSPRGRQLPQPGESLEFRSATAPSATATTRTACCAASASTHQHDPP